MLTHSDFQKVHKYSANGVLAYNKAGIIVYSNPKLSDDLLSGLAHLGEHIDSLLESIDGIPLTSDLLADADQSDKEFCLKTAAGSTSILLSSSEFTDANDTLTYLFIRDIGQLKKKERLYTYLNSAVETLSRARDTKTALDEISKVIVPSFANWFSIDLLVDGRIEELVLGHEDPDMVSWARQYRAAYPTNLNSDTGLAGVLKTGQSSFTPIITEEMILAATPNSKQLSLIQKMNLQSVMIVPVLGMALKGAVTFVSSTVGRPYDDVDLEFAESFATHIALALENARLNEAAAREIDQRKEIEQKLRLTQMQLKSALSSGLVGIWISDLETGTIYMDENLSRMYGVTYQPEGSKQNVLGNVVHPDDQQLIQHLDPTVLVEGRVYESEFRVVREGITHWFFARGSLDSNEPGKLFVGVVVDITQRKEAELALQENEQRKDEFLSIASHELKTPLTSIKAFNQVMAKAVTEEKLAKFITRSAEQIHRLERLINDLLDVTKINAGKLSYTFEDFSIHNTILHAKENFQHKSTHELIIQNSADVVIIGDRLRLEQVFDNLLANAIKYSPEAEKVIINSFVEDNSVIVSIQDFGIGIDPENLHKLFDRYYRVDNTAMRFEGLGLGLYISSEILKRHQGSFWIESEPGKGSTFFVRLPLPTAQGSNKTKKTRDFYQDDHLSIQFNKEKKRLDVSWTGFQDRTTVERGALLMLEYLKDHNLSRVINDNTYVKGNWADAVDWVGNTWFPMMEAAGLKYFAHIFSPIIFSQLAAKKSIDIMAGIVTTQYFTEVKAAEKWIESTL